MNILMISPQFPDTFWSFKYGLKFIRKKAAYPPLGLLTVAAMLPDEFNKRLVDANVDTLSEDDLAWADIAFIGAMAVQRDSAQHIIARCRAADLKVVAGGPLFTAEPGAFEEVDHLVLDEAELTLPSFLEDLKNGHLKKNYRASGFCDLDHTPCPAWNLIDMKKYVKKFKTRIGISSMMSRFCSAPGCRFRGALLSALTAIAPRLFSSSSILSKKVALQPPW